MPNDVAANADVPDFILDLGDTPMNSNQANPTTEMDVLQKLMEQLVISNKNQENLIKHLPTTAEGQHEKELKVAPPEQYDGRPEKLRAFLISLELVFGANPSLYKNDRRKIFYALSYMQAGITKQWVDTKMEEGRAGRLKWATYKDFEAAVKSSFESANITEDAQLAIENLTQGNSTAEVFFEYFDAYRYDSGYNIRKTYSTFTLTFEMVFDFVQLLAEVFCLDSTLTFGNGLLLGNMSCDVL